MPIDCTAGMKCLLPDMLMQKNPSKFTFKFNVIYLLLRLSNIFELFSNLFRCLADMICPDRRQDYVTVSTGWW